MKKSLLVIATVVVTALTGGVTGAAAAAPELKVGRALGNATSERAYVDWLARFHPVPVVRGWAWAALVSSAGDAAIAQFLDVGLASALQRGEDARQRNLSFVERVLTTHTRKSAPNVYVAARNARDDGTAPVLQQFVSSGFADAKELDRKLREADAKNAEALRQEDRAFVTQIRDTYPGAQVRAAAAWALRPEATDADLMEFFAFEWANAASADVVSVSDAVRRQ